MRPHVKGILIFSAIIVMAFLIGSYILTATFFGTLTLVGMIVLVENIPVLKWLVGKSSSVLDVLLFVFTIMATASFGLNIAASLTVAGIGYSLVYAPYLREQAKERRAKAKKRPTGSFRSKFDFM